MVQVFHWGLFQGWEAVGVEASGHNELVEVGGFSREVLGRGTQGEDVETFPKDPFETVKARIVSGDDT